MKKHDAEDVKCDCAEGSCDCVHEEADIQKGKSTEKSDKKHKKEMTKEEILQDQIKKLQTEKAEAVGTAQYIQAEFENYKKRQDRDFAKRVDMASHNVISNLIPVLDEFEFSINALKASDAGDAVIKGFELFESNFFKVLGKEGLSKINEVDVKFDTNLHEAVMQAPVEGKESMTVVEVFQSGYKLNDKVIRHAKVKVAQ